MIGRMSKPPAGLSAAAIALLTVLSSTGFAEDGASKPSLKPLEPAAFDAAAARHLLDRAAFGGTPQEIATLAEMGLDKAVDHLLGAEDDFKEFEATLTDRPDYRKMRQLKKEERQKIQREHRRKDRRQFDQLRAWWFRRMVVGKAPLREKMTCFWHGHFATSYREVKNSYHMYLQNETLRKHALGNFKELATAVSKDPAMLRYLNNNQNRRGRPNENYARELMELFTLGVGNYTETDIKEAARALTGWSARGNEFVFFRRAHDPGVKEFLGKKGRFTGKEIIDVIFEQEAVNRFVVRKLVKFFATENPSDGLVEALAATFREGNFEIRPVLAQLFRSDEFYSKSCRGNHIKSPVELVVSTLRLLHVDRGNSPGASLLAGQMGQELFVPPNVKGWDGGESWITTSTLFNRYNFAQPFLAVDQRRGRTDGARDRSRRRPGRDFLMRRVPHWTPESVEKILGEDSRKLDSEVVVDRLLAHFLTVPVDTEARMRLIEAHQQAEGRGKLAELVHLILSSPQYQLN